MRKVRTFLTWLLATFATVLALGSAPAIAGEFRVCADPNNLPFSNAKGQGFENHIAELLANDLHEKLVYTWWAQRRGYIKHALRAGLCDLVMGVPANLDMLQTTRPYYRSIYMFVTREDRHLDIESLNDPRLKTLQVGVQLIGDDGSNTPPADGLARRGIIKNVHGYMIYGDYRSPEPTAPIVQAVAKGDIDVAMVWGPQAAYFAREESVPLRLAPVKPMLDGPTLPMVFDISIGVRKEDGALRHQLDEALARNRGEIDRILASYAVPRVDRSRFASHR
jgi:mxaJ protein